MDSSFSILNNTHLFDETLDIGFKLLYSLNKLKAHLFVTFLHVHRAISGVLQVFPVEKVSGSEAITLHIGLDFTWTTDTVPEVDICDVSYKGLIWIKASPITVLVLSQNYIGSTVENGSVSQNFPITTLPVGPQCCQASGGVPRPTNRVPLICVIGQPGDVKSRPFDMQPVHTDRGLKEQEGVGLRRDCQGEQRLGSGQ